MYFNFVYLSLVLVLRHTVANTENQRISNIICHKTPKRKKINAIVAEFIYFSTRLSIFERLPCRWKNQSTPCKLKTVYILSNMRVFGHRRIIINLFLFSLWWCAKTCVLAKKILINKYTVEKRLWARPARAKTKQWNQNILWSSKFVLIR